MRISDWSSDVCSSDLPSYMTSASFSILTNQLKEWGYDTHATILQGEDFGCLEHRDRMALVAVTEGIDFDIESLVVPNHEPALLGDYLEDIDLDSPLSIGRAHV